ncbi:MAG: hypothetical protein AB7P17_15710 [Nitrospirales bacterium]
MSALFQAIGRGIVIIVLYANGGCSDSSTDFVIEEPKVDQSKFMASVSGSVQGEVAGSGIVTYLPPREGSPATGTRPGYFLIANINSDSSDSAAEREFIIIFRIPDTARSGHYDLVAQDPLKVGQNFDVRVETVEGGKSIAYHTNTEGTITLENFSPRQTDTGKNNITGRFQFVTENNQSDQISIKGTFDLPLRRNLVSQDLVYSVNDPSRG